MSEQRHRIRRQIVEIQVGQQSAAWPLQNALSQLQRTEIERLLDTALSQHGPADALLRIDRLELDLGTLRPQHFAQDLLAKLAPALAGALQQQQQAAARAAGVLDEDPRTQTQLELLQFFAETGQVPWWADARQSQLLPAALRTVLDDNRPAARRALATLLRDSRRRLRLLQHLADPELIRLCRSLADSAGTACRLPAADLEAGLRALLPAVRADGEGRLGQSAGRLRLALFGATLGWLATLSSATSAEGSAWQILLLQWAVASDLTYAGLLAGLAALFPPPARTDLPFALQQLLPPPTPAKSDGATRQSARDSGAQSANSSQDLSPNDSQDLSSNLSDSTSAPRSATDSPAAAAPAPALPTLPTPTEGSPESAGDPAISSTIDQVSGDSPSLTAAASEDRDADLGRAANGAQFIEQSISQYTHQSIKESTHQSNTESEAQTDWQFSSQSLPIFAAAAGTDPPALAGSAAGGESDGPALGLASDGPQRPQPAEATSAQTPAPTDPRAHYPAPSLAPVAAARVGEASRQPDALARATAPQPEPQTQTKPAAAPDTEAAPLLRLRDQLLQLCGPSSPRPPAILDSVLRLLDGLDAAGGAGAMPTPHLQRLLQHLPRLRSRVLLPPATLRLATAALQAELQSRPPSPEQRQPPSERRAQGRLRPGDPTPNATTNSAPNAMPNATPDLAANPAVLPSEEAYVTGAGLVFLWPFLPSLFTHLGLCLDGQFVDPPARHRAVGLLHHLVTGDALPVEYQLTLAKVLCRLPDREPLYFDEPVTAAESAECHKLLVAAIAHATVLGDMSPADFRTLFLLQDGVLSPRAESLLLRIERTPQGALIERFPWPIRWIRLPWNPVPLYVDC